MSQQTFLAYLDHNVLDLMTKGDPDGVGARLARHSLTPVFSNENLSEIRRSGGYEDNFIQLLDTLGARYLVPLLDTDSKPTGEAEIRQVSAADAYQAFITEQTGLPEYGFGMTGMLEKMYGGRAEESFAGIFSAGVNELQALLQTLEEGLPEVAGIDDEMRVELRRLIETLPDMMREEYRQIGQEMDACQGAPFVRQFEETSGLGPKVLKNIRGPGVLQKVWALVQERLPGVDLDFDTFFGVKPFPFEADANRERTTLEKVNGIYHQLNFLGYYRDSKMSRPRRFAAHFSDLTHAGLATFCQVLLCRDEDLVMKAAAAYEYLGVRTLIVHYGGNTAVEPTR